MNLYYKDIKLTVSENVYEPREDSILIAEALEEKLKEKKYKTILEVGCGSGLLSIIAAKQSAVTCVDLNPRAVEITKKNAESNNVKIKCFVSDLFKNVEGKFDLIVFNPPYLPDKDKIKGSEMWSDDGTIKRFIEQSKQHLEKNGEILLLISSLTGLKRIQTLFKDNNFSVNIIKNKKVPWEDLLVLEAKLL